MKHSVRLQRTRQPPVLPETRRAMVDRMMATVGDHQVSEESVHFCPTVTPLLMSMARENGKNES